MKKVFISQPMGGIYQDKFERDRAAAKQHIYNALGGIPIEFIESYIEENPDINFRFKSREPIWYLAQALILLADADYIYFVNGWQTARGCKVERLVAEEYDIPIIE